MFAEIYKRKKLRSIFYHLPVIYHAIFAPTVVHMLCEKCTYREAIWTHTHWDGRFMIYSDTEALGCNEWGKLVLPGCTWIDDYSSLLLHWIQPVKPQALLQQHTTTQSEWEEEQDWWYTAHPFVSLTHPSVLTAFCLSLPCYVCERASSWDWIRLSLIVCPKFVPRDQILSTKWNSMYSQQPAQFNLYIPSKIYQFLMDFLSLLSIVINKFCAAVPVIAAASLAHSAIGFACPNA